MTTAPALVRAAVAASAIVFWALSCSLANAQTHQAFDVEDKGDYVAPDDDSMLYLQTKVRVLEEQINAANHQIVALTTELRTVQVRHHNLLTALLEAGLIKVERDE